MTGCGDAERFWYDRESAGQAREAVSAANLRHHSLAHEQQVGQSAPAGRRSHLPHRCSHENLSGGDLTFFFEYNNNIGSMNY